MPTIYEHRDSRAIGMHQSTLAYVTKDYDDEFAAEAALLATAPAELVNGHVVDDYKLAEKFRAGAYLFTVQYKSPERRALENTDPTPLEVGEFAFSFDTTGASEPITQSLATRAYDSTGAATAKDNMFGNGIRITGNPPNLSAEGTTVVVPALRFQIRAALPNSLITIKYAKLVSKLTGRTNNAVFPPTSMPFVDEQFAIDAVLFLGATGSWNLQGNIELVFHFDSGEAVSNLETGDIIGIAKAPHEFVWYRYKTEDDTTNKRTVLKPDIAFVEKVYESDNLGQLFTGPDPPP